MSVPTLDDRARAFLEPCAPPIEARLRCLQTLADAGLDTFVSFAPAYPPTGDVTADAIATEFAARGVTEVFTRTLDERWGVREAMSSRLQDSEIASEVARSSDDGDMGGFLVDLADACPAQGGTCPGDGRYRKQDRTSDGTLDSSHPT